MITEVFNGYTIRVGRNRKENDKIVQESKPMDVWLHLSAHPSGHAVISNPDGTKVPNTVIKRGCTLVKIYSKYSHLKGILCDVAYMKSLLTTPYEGLVDVRTVIKTIAI